MGEGRSPYEREPQQSAGVPYYPPAPERGSAGVQPTQPAPAAYDAGPARRPGLRKPGAVAALVAAGVLTTVSVAAAILALLWFVWPGWGQDDDDDDRPGGPVASPPSAGASPSASPSASPPASPSAPATGSGERFETAAYSLEIPEGWREGASSGDRNSGQLVDDGSNRITVYDLGDAMPQCRVELEVLEIWVPGTIAPLPDREIGGVVATGGSLTGDAGEYHEIYCVEAAGNVWQVTLATTLDERDDVVADFALALDSWTWR